MENIQMPRAGEVAEGLSALQSMTESGMNTALTAQQACTREDDSTAATQLNMSQA